MHIALQFVHLGGAINAPLPKTQSVQAITQGGVSIRQVERRNVPLLPALHLLCVLTHCTMISDTVQ